MANLINKTKENYIFPNRNIVASVLASRKVDVFFDPAAETAHYDLEQNVICIPLWKDMDLYTYDFLIMHEISHGIFTTLERWFGSLKNGEIHKNPAFAKNLLNIVEDARVDRLMKEKFPGAKKDYYLGTKWLFDNRKDLFLGKRKLSSMGLPDRLNIHFKFGNFIDVPFSSEERTKFVDPIGKIQTIDEAIDIARELGKLSARVELDLFSLGKWVNPSQDMIDDISKKIQEEEKKAKEEEKISEMSSEEDESSDKDEREVNPGQSPSGRDPGSNKESDEDDKGEDISNDNGSEKNSDEFVDENSVVSGELKEEKEELKEETEESRKKTEEAIEEASNANSLSGSIAKDMKRSSVGVPVYYQADLVNDFSAPEFVTDFPEILEEYNSLWNPENGIVSESAQKSIRGSWMKFRRSIEKQVNALAQLFEQKKSAASLRHVQISNTGILNMAKVHSYRYDNDVFLRKDSVPEAKNHGFIMLVDWSSSMISNHVLWNTVKQTLMLSEFCRKINVPFDVYTFGNGETFNSKLLQGRKYIDHQEDEFDFTKKLEHDKHHSVLRCFLSSRMNLPQYNRMAEIFLEISKGKNRSHRDSNGCTPLDPALMISGHLSVQFKKRTPVEFMNIIALTDGGNSAPFIYDYNKLPKDEMGDFRPIKYVARNPVNSKYYIMDGRFATSNNTKNIAQAMKDQYGVNIISMFLTDRVELAFVSDVFKDNRNTELQRKFWKSHGYLALDVPGFDEYFFINPECFQFEGFDYDSLKKATTKAELERVFTSSKKKTHSSFAVLNRFIDSMNSKGFF